MTSPWTLIKQLRREKRKDLSRYNTALPILYGIDVLFFSAMGKKA
jgi:hypothetical protein